MLSRSLDEEVLLLCYEFPGGDGDRGIAILGGDVQSRRILPAGAVAPIAGIPGAQAGDQRVIVIDGQRAALDADPAGRAADRAAADGGAAGYSCSKCGRQRGSCAGA